MICLGILGAAWYAFTYDSLEILVNASIIATLLSDNSFLAYFDV